MAGTGPVPNPASRRQSGSQAGTWTDLPAGGFTGVVPEWPLPGKPAAAERLMWARYWVKPQAAAWSAMGMVDEVALYVRAFLAAAAGDSRVAPEARQWASILGLTPASMLKNRWRIREVEVGESPAASSSPRRTLKVAE